MTKTLDLNGKWKLWHCEDGQGRLDQLDGVPWIDAEVPGCAHHDLLTRGTIDDPFFEKDSIKLRELEGHEWWYTRQFHVRDDFTGDRIEMVFEGLDTFATVWVNGRHIGAHSNMFVPARFDVGDAISPGQVNTVVVRLTSPIEAVDGLPLEGTMATVNTPERLWARKTDQCYGWDIAPRIVTAGIWRPVKLVAQSRARIGADFFRTAKIDPLPADPDGPPPTATIRHDIPVERLADDCGRLSLRVRGICGDSEFAEGTSVEDAAARLQFDITDATLWWTWDIGAPELYDLTITLYEDDEPIDQVSRKQGIRMVRLVQEPREDGAAPYVFELNGVRVFARGMNWTPADCYHARAEGEKHRWLLEMCKRMNLNMLRVWGGGVYEPDAWFRQLDELGIMVYQDFMMACGVYPVHPDFLSVIADEAETIIKKLRNYACLALWCGDNENDVAYWDWSDEKLDVRDNAITRQVLPQAVDEFDGTRDYVPSSPYSPDPDVHPQDQDQGDTHVWHHGTPFDDPVYTEDESRFISEIGHLSCPPLETVRGFLGPANLWPNDNAAWDHHIGVHDDLDFRPPRRQAMDDSVIAYFGQKPDNLERYILASQICQGEAYKLWVEHCRQRKHDWRCGGVLLWNVADCWPQFSDAVIDYYLRPKLACNYVRWACEPVHVSFMPQADGGLALHAANDTLSDLDVTYSVTVELAPGIPDDGLEGQADIPPNSSVIVADISGLADKARQGGRRLLARLYAGRELISWNRHRFDKPTLDEIPQIVSDLPAFGAEPPPAHDR